MNNVEYVIEFSKDKPLAEFVDKMTKNRIQADNLKSVPNCNSTNTTVESHSRASCKSVMNLTDGEDCYW